MGFLQERLEKFGVSDRKKRAVGARFDRSRILKLLSEDRTRLGRRGRREGIRVYLEGYTGYLRGLFYSALEEAGHPGIAEALRGLPQDEFLAELRRRRGYFGTIVPESLQYYARISSEKERISRIDDLIERSYVERGLSDYNLLLHASEIFEEEIQFLDELEDTLIERGTAGSLRRAEEVRKLRERAKDKKEEIDKMFPPPQVLRRAKIRIYNKAFKAVGKETVSPKGKFQIWHEIDVLADPTGRVDWTWWLTKKEISICLDAYISYWSWKGEKDGMEFDYSDQIKQVTLDYPGRPEETPEGVVVRDQSATERGEVKSRYWGSGPSKFPFPMESGAISKSQFAEQVSRRVDKPMKELTTEDLIIGESAQPLAEPVVPEPQGIIHQKAMKIDPDTGEPEWVDSREYRIHWDTEDEDLERARKDLKRRGII